MEECILKQTFLILTIRPAVTLHTIFYSWVLPTSQLMQEIQSWKQNEGGYFKTYILDFKF